MADAPLTVRLKPETVSSFEQYVREAEAAMAETQHPNGPFLWSDSNSDRQHRLRAGKIEAELWSGDKAVSVTDGLIHDWIGEAFAKDVTVAEAIALVQDYDNHKIIYQPDVVDSRLISRDGNFFKIFLRLLKKKIITVVLDTEHDVFYSRYGENRWTCRSYTTRIAEVEDANTPKEHTLPVDSGYGFLWRLYSYWRFEEKEGGVYLECRAISLTRDVPLGLGWMIEPVIRKLPKESLTNTLAATRKALTK